MKGFTERTAGSFRGSVDSPGSGVGEGGSVSADVCYVAEGITGEFEMENRKVNGDHLLMTGVTSGLPSKKCLSYW